MRAAGIRVVDATEGGLAKAHTEAATLAEALAAVSDDAPVRLPAVPPRASIRGADAAGDAAG